MRGHTDKLIKERVFFEKTSRGDIEGGSASWSLDYSREMAICMKTIVSLMFLTASF